MYGEDKELLEQTYALAVENNRLLKKMRRGAWFGFFFKLLFWGIMLGIPVWLYFTMFQPIMDQALGALEQVQDVTGQVQGLPNIPTDQLQKLLEILPNIDISAITGGQN